MHSTWFVSLLGRAWTLFLAQTAGVATHQHWQKTYALLPGLRSSENSKSTACCRGSKVCFPHVVLRTSVLVASGLHVSNKVDLNWSKQWKYGYTYHNPWPEQHDCVRPMGSVPTQQCTLLLPNAGTSLLVSFSRNTCRARVCSANSVSTLRAWSRCFSWYLPVNFRKKCLLWIFQVHFDCTGSHKARTKCGPRFWPAAFYL